MKVSNTAGLCPAVIYYYIFNTVDRQFDKIIPRDNDLGYSSSIKDNKIVFYYKDSIHCYSILTKTEKEIYDLNGKELFMLFDNGIWCVLIAADDVIKKLANNWPFILIVVART